MKMSKKIQELEQEIACNKWWIEYYKKIIKNAWWVLTDIDSQDLNREIYTKMVIDSLHEISCEVLDKEDKNVK